MMNGTDYCYQAEDGIRDTSVTGVQTCALPIWANAAEPVERRAGAKGNAHQQSTHWTQSQARVSQALERIRSEERRVGKEWGSWGGTQQERIRVRRASAVRTLKHRAATAS